MNRSHASSFVSPLIGCVLVLLTTSGTLLAISYSDVSAYWKADGNTTDSAANNNDGTLFNGATYATGIKGQAFSFDGSDDYFTAPTSAFPVGSSDRSMTLWIRSPDVTVPNKMLGGWGNGATSQMSALILGLDALPTGKPAFWGWVNDLESTTTLTDDTWHHIGFTLTGGTSMKVYVDGNMITSGTLSSSLATPSGSTFYLADFTAVMGSYGGLIDDIAVFNRALTDEEILDIANGGAIPEPSGALLALIGLALLAARRRR